MTFHNIYSKFFPVLAVATILSIILMPLAIRFLCKFGIMDIPNARKMHVKPIPRMGGVVIYIAFAVAILIFRPTDTHWQGILYGSGVALLIGCADDIWNVRAPIKLVSLFALTILIWQFGIITNLPIREFFDCEKICLINTIFNLIVTMVWLTGICSAINALDHMDGLAAGVSVIAALAYFCVSLQTAQYEWAIISLALIGSLMGFLLYNKYPAKVFMGDSGSFFLGFSLASIGIMGGWSSNPIKAMIVPITVLSVPIFDLCFVVISRRLNGTTNSILESINYCGKDHIGHRLHSMGFSHRISVRIVYLLAATIAVSALLLRDTDNLQSFLLLIQIIMVYSMVVIFMNVALENSAK
jgi:UDP-GlcNAc:undecaprenyl-phosphate GlcNAc-1-phosphate transferase